MTQNGDAAISTNVIEAEPAPVSAATESWNALPDPSVTRIPTARDGLLTYGLVAKVSLNRPAFGFRIEHDLPHGVELVEATPRATVVGEHLIWQLGRVDPGQEIRLSVVIKLNPDSPIDPKQLANFEATYSQNLYFEAPVVRPRLSARIRGSASTKIGAAVELTFDSVNSGNWPVDDVRAVVVLPPQFVHPSGPRFTFDFGTVKPGECRRVKLLARAIAQGDDPVRLDLTGAPDLRANAEFVAAATA